MPRGRPADPLDALSSSSLADVNGFSERVAAVETAEVTGAKQAQQKKA
jgi:hypothetical protein